MTVRPRGEVGSSGMCSLMTSGSTFDPTIRCQMRIISMPCGFTNGVSPHAATIATRRNAVRQLWIGERGA